MRTMEVAYKGFSLQTQELGRLQAGSEFCATRAARWRSRQAAMKADGVVV